MSTGYRIHEKDGAHFLTFQVVGWVDLFTRRDYRNVVIESFKSYTSKRFLEIMESGTESRREWMKRVFEHYATYKEKQAHQLWTHENHAEHVYSQKFIEQKVQYIHNNPVRSGIVAKPEDYLYSSARNYAGLESVIDVIEVDFRWQTYH